jgi:excisionase family DNA binding protein
MDEQKRGRLIASPSPMPKRSGAPLWTTRDVAARLNVSPETVLRRWRRGELPGYRIASNALRFDPADIDAWLRECCQNCQHDRSEPNQEDDGR